MEKKFDIEINPEVAKGNYANLAIITHSSSEFILDFAQNMPGLPKMQVNSRIIMTPEHAKRLLGALTENIRKYEGQFGEIKLPIGPTMMPPIKPDAEA
ncbi:MAG: DUF3467 domain-containing protein [Bacteroidales bacterium]|nr:DUF3467 domain-containing protein [Bacteroidales bacterium]